MKLLPSWLMHILKLHWNMFSVALCPERLYGLLGMGSSGCPPRLYAAPELWNTPVQPVANKACGFYCLPKNCMHHHIFLSKSEELKDFKAYRPSNPPTPTPAYKQQQKVCVCVCMCGRVRTLCVCVCACCTWYSMSQDVLWKIQNNYSWFTLVYSQTTADPRFLLLPVKDSCQSAASHVPLYT